MVKMHCQIQDSAAVMLQGAERTVFRQRGFALHGPPAWTEDQNLPGFCSDIINKWCGWARRLKNILKAG